MGIEDHIQESIGKFKRHQEDMERQASAYLTEEIQRLRDEIGNRKVYAYRGRGIRWWSSGDVSTAKEWRTPGPYQVGSIVFQGQVTSPVDIGNGNVYLPEWDISLGSDSLAYSSDYDILTRALDVVQKAATLKEHTLGHIIIEIPRRLHFLSDNAKFQRVLRKFESLVESYHSGPTGK